MRRLGAIEFTAKAAGQTFIWIDYDLFSESARIVLSRALLVVKVTVEQ